MALDLTNGNRPPGALQKAMGNSAPRLTDEQCQAFYDMVEAHGGMPFGHSEAQQDFRAAYTIEGEGAARRWVKQKGAG